MTKGLEPGDTHAFHTLTAEQAMKINTHKGFPGLVAEGQEVAIVVRDGKRLYQVGLGYRELLEI